MQVLAAIVAIVAGIRIVFWLLQPIWPYLAAVAVLWAFRQLRRWWIDRW